MTVYRVIAHDPSPAVHRLEALAPLDRRAIDALEAAMQRPRAIRPRCDLLTEGAEIGEPLLVLDGWAARVRQLADGRRQILNFILPGDLVGLYDQDRPVASSTVMAFTPVLICEAPGRGTSLALDRAYAMSRALDETHLLAQITRLGRFNAHERIADLLLELLERLELAGLASNGRYSLPLTQEVLADALGLTPVHINRMLQQSRRAGELSWSGRDLILRDPEALREQIGRQPVRVAAALDRGSGIRATGRAQGAILDA
jgi:CRP-like cAMP-binding protein